MAPRPLIFFTVLMATTAIAYPLAARDALDTRDNAAKEASVTPDIVFDYGGDSQALDARDGNADGAITATDASVADDDEATPDLVFVAWGETPPTVRDGNADGAMAAKVRHR
ncbi:hypothetical protein PG985_013063 [Apiospora marii]|uniref:uncharacterized protein n=1 Tax=Apiospora marii TaxID=335849 RepID=UPI00312D59C8